MTISTKTLGLLVAGTLALSSCGDKAADTSTSTTTDSKTTMAAAPDTTTKTTAPATTTPTPPAEAKMTNADFVMKASAVNMAEIDAHKAAIAMGGADVKMHAKMMLADHTKMGNDVKALATKKNWTLATDAPADKKQMLADVKMKKGKEFDMAYLDAQENDHKEVIAMFQKAQNDVDDADLKALIGKAIPQLESHLKMVQDAKAKMGASKM